MPWRVEPTRDGRRPIEEPLKAALCRQWIVVANLGASAFSWSQGTRSLISTMSPGHLEDILRPYYRPYYLHFVLVELDRATAQGFDILMQAVTTRLELLERNHFQHFL